MEYFDLHCDTATECMERGCGLYENDRNVSLKRAEKYSRWAQVFAVWIPEKLHGADAYRYFRKAAGFFAGEMEKNRGRVRFCRTPAELRGAGPRAALLSIEGGAALDGKIGHLYDARRLGVRMMTLTWNGRCELGDGCMVPDAGGLTPFGFEVVREMERLHITVDVSHLSEKGFWDVARAARRPFVASHSDSRAVCGHPRNLTDSQFRELAQAGGLAGINLHRDFLRGKNASLDDALDHIAHFLNLGGEKAVAIGSDFDGCTLPKGVSGVQDMDRLYAMVSKSFGAETADDIFWRNAYRFFSSEDTAL